MKILTVNKSCNKTNNELPEKHVCLLHSSIYLQKTIRVLAGESHIRLVASWEANLSTFILTVIITPKNQLVQLLLSASIFLLTCTSVV